MPPPLPCWPAQSLMRLWEVSYPPHQAGLAFWKDWRDSCLYSVLIPSVTERSTLFVRNRRSHIRRQLMMHFSTGTRLECDGIVGSELELPLGQSAGPGCCAFLQKQVTKGGSAGFCPLPLRCQSQFFPDEGIDRLFIPMWWPGIYSICFFQLDGGKDSFPCGGIFCLYLYQFNKR